MQIRWVTCDNATNNDTMMVHFAELIKEATGKPYDYKNWHIWYVINLLLQTSANQFTSCIAHIVNPTTQPLIATHTKSKHYDPAKPDDDLIVDHDEVGLVHSITVKVPCLTNPSYLNCCLTGNKGVLIQ